VLDPRSSGWLQIGEALAGWNTLVLAVSGGPDSMGMLAGLVSLKQAGLLPSKLVCVTVDHGLRPGSVDDVRKVEAACQHFEVRCETVSLSTLPGSGNRHNWARWARYEAFARVASQRPGTAAVLTAHTEDDQAETFLMRAGRVSGSDGLAGIHAEQVVKRKGLFGVLATK